MKVRFFDLRVKDKKLNKELVNSVKRVFSHGQVLLGPEVDQFEKKIAKMTGSKYAIGVGSGSSALYLALKGIGVKKGDEIITTPLTWIITLNAIAECGAIPVCVDIDEDFNIDPNKIEKAITKKTKAIVPVHFTGLMCKMDQIKSIAKKFNLKVIEDAAQAFGAKYKGKKVGSFSDVASFSFNVMKNVGGFGEAGAVTTNNKKIYELVKMLRYTGTKSDPKKIISNECYHVALNHKIDTVHAAMLLVLLKYFKKKMDKRIEIANIYNNELQDFVKCPSISSPGTSHGLYTYAIQTNYRDKLMNYLSENGIQNKIYHIPLASDAPIFKKYRRFKTPVAREVLSKILSLPAHEKITSSQQAYVIEKIKNFFKII